MSSLSAITQFLFSLSPVFFLPSFLKCEQGKHRANPWRCEGGYGMQAVHQEHWAQWKKRKQMLTVPKLRSMTGESPEEGNKQFQKRAASTEEMTLWLGLRGWACPGRKEERRSRQKHRTSQAGTPFPSCSLSTSPLSSSPKSSLSYFCLNKILIKCRTIPCQVQC